MTQKLVSIVTPCYNSGEHIHRLLKSVLNQKYKEIELIIINDGSTDNTLDVIEKFKAKFDSAGLKLVVISKENGGVASAINLGLKQFSGDYITFVDSDDYLNSESIKKRVEYLEKNKTIGAVYSWVNEVREDNIDEVKRILGKNFSVDQTNLFTNILTEENYIWPPVAYLIRSESLLAVLKKRDIEEFEVGQNIQLFLPLWYKTRVGLIQESLVTVVARDDSHSRRNRGEDETQRQRSIEQAYLKTLERIPMSDKEKSKYVDIITNKYTQINQRIFIDRIDGRDELTRLYDRDKERFNNSFFKDARNASQKQLASRMIFSSHSLEKSLSNDGFEIGHGFMVVKLLVGFLDQYRKSKYDTSHLAYINTLSVLRSFYLRHDETKYTDEIKNILGSWTDDVLSCQSDIGGSDTIDISSKTNNHTKDFKELANGRFAVRTYANKKVKKSDINEAVEIAMKTPTVCNRQSLRLRTMYEKEIIAKVLEIQGGIAHYETPPVLLLVTADDSGYVGVNERNQGYIDGGLFAMSILYALEYKGLAACPLHAMFEAERDFRVRGMLNIPESEKLVTFISVGHFGKINNVCKSFRYPAEYILEEVTTINNNFRIETIVTEPSGETEDVLSSSPALIDRFRIKLKIRTRLRNFLKLIGEYLDRKEYKKADGVILTLTGYFNYGNVMQRYALQSYLLKNGLRFVAYADQLSGPKDIYKVGRKVRYKKPLRMFKRILKRQRPYWYTPKVSELYPEVHRLENIINFVNNNIWIKPFDLRDGYNKYIVGSDQVWRDWWNKREAIGYYFLDFVKDHNAKRIAYAASFGKDTIEEVIKTDDIEYLKPYVEQFDNISVREKTGVKLIENTWGVKNTEVVVDPTLLLEASDYSELIDDSDAKYSQIQPIFSYVLGETTEVKAMIESIQDVRQQAVTKIRAHQGSENDVHPPVEFWLKGFRDAELVVTNSFHGMMFSVINNTDFIIIGKAEGGLSRIKDFLSEYEIEGRFVEESRVASFDVKHLKPIDWEKVNRILEKNKQKSGKWLLDSVRG